MKKFLAALFAQSFLLNFIWEVTQMPLYLSTGMGEREEYLTFLNVHWTVSIFDAATVLAAYILIGAIRRNLRWGLASDERGWAFFVFGLLIWQILTEYLAVYVYHRWAYAPAMPLVFGIGVSPLAQMAVLGPLAIFLIRHLLKVQK